MPIPIAIAVLFFAHMFDLVSFLMMTARHGLAAEANPIVIRLAEQLGLPGLTIAKLLAVVVAVCVFVVLAPRNPRLAAGVLGFGIIAGVVGGMTNLATL